MRPNKGVAQRVAKDDAAWAKLNNRTAESVETQLKRKAEIYEKLQKGKTGGLSSAQLDNLLIDVSHALLKYTQGLTFL
jgi:hypothetical protein